MLPHEYASVGRTIEACETRPMQDYPETPTEVREEQHQESIAESRAPPEMLAAQREWDAEIERHHRL
jgi:hypothetical protein